MPKSADPLKEIENTLAALKKQRKKFQNSKPHGTLDDFTTEAALYKKKIIETAGVKDIDVLSGKEALSDENIETLRNNGNLALSFKEVESLYRQFSEHCDHYRTSIFTAKVVIDAKTLADQGIKVLKKIKQLDKEHEEGWSEKTGQKVGGDPNVGGNIYSLVFTIAPVFTMDYKDRLIALINLLAAFYTKVKNLYGSVSLEQQQQIVDFLNDETHLIVLRRILERDPKEFYVDVAKKVVEDARKSVTDNSQPNNGKPTLTIIPDNVSAGPDYEYELTKYRELLDLEERLQNPEQESRITIAADSQEISKDVLEAQTSYLKEYTDIKALLSKIREKLTKTSADQNDKILFLQVCKNIYTKLEQRYKIAAEVCTHLDGLLSIDEEWKTFNEKMNEFDVRIVKEKIKEVRAALDAFLQQDINAPLRLPQGIQASLKLWGHGSIGLFLIDPLNEHIASLQREGIRLNATPDSLRTPVSSRPGSQMSNMSRLRSTIMSTESSRNSYASSTKAHSPLSVRDSIISLVDSILEDEEDAEKSSSAEASTSQAVVPTEKIKPAEKIKPQLGSLRVPAAKKPGITPAPSFFADSSFADPRTSPKNATISHGARRTYEPAKHSSLRHPVSHDSAAPAPSAGELALALPKRMTNKPHVASVFSDPPATESSSSSSEASGSTVKVSEVRDRFDKLAARASTASLRPEKAVDLGIVRFDSTPNLRKEDNGHAKVNGADKPQQSKTFGSL